MKELSMLYASIGFEEWGLAEWGSLASLLALAATLILGAARLFLFAEIFPITWSHSVAAAMKIVRLIGRDGWVPDLVICLGRSGGIWGGFISGNIGSKPAFMVMDYYNNSNAYVQFEYLQECASAIRKHGASRVLVIQGYTGTGGTFFALREAIAAFPTLRNVEFRYGVVFAWANCRFPLDYVGRVLRRPPKRMPWHKTSAYVTAMNGHKKE
ncbi:MAG: hypothetical protein ACE37J_15970 [Pikeienuella sp.]|uniref:hypothetical protein n=1 Tax=Pikeienuella sp. TaxID=2831957 RepID=UPI00391A9187